MKYYSKIQLHIDKKLFHQVMIILSCLLFSIINTLPLKAFDDIYSDSEIQFIDPNACNPNQGQADDGSSSDGSAQGSGKWSIQAGVPTNITEDFKQFMDKVAQHTSYEPIITTTTNGQHAAGSDHYSGNGGDFGSVKNEFGTNDAQPGQDVPRGDNLAAASLIAAGVDETTAKAKAKNGLTPGLDDVTTTINGAAFRVQTIWKTSGHHDHVHIGIKRATAATTTESALDTVASTFTTPTAHAADNPTTPDGMTGNSDVEKVYNRLVELGLPPKATAGIVGNLVFESGASTGYRTSEKLNPRADNGNHWGIVQWDATRWNNLKSFAKTRDVYSLNVQTEFIWEELQKNATNHDVLNLIKDAEPDEAARIINAKYEITGVQEGRAEAATYFYNKYKDGGGVTTAGDEPVTGCCPTSTGASTASLAPGSGSPTGVVFPQLDPEGMATAIDKYIEKTQAQSPLKGAGPKIVASAKEANINPFLIVGIAQKESGLGAPGDYNTSNANNLFGRTATQSQPNHYSPSVGRYWYKWTSVHNSVDHTAPENAGKAGDIAEYIRNSGFYDKGLASGKLYDIMSVYAPPSENNTALYTQNLKDWMARMASMVGNSSSGNTEQVSTGTPLVGCSCTDPTALTDGSTTGDSSDPSTWKKIYETNPAISNSMAKGDLPKPKALIIHFTVGNSEGASLLSSMANSGVGVQFNVGKAGTVYQTFPLDDMKVAYHVKENNSRAIGIEITGMDGKEIINNQKQFDSVVALSKKLIEKYEIPADNPIGLITGTDDPLKTQGLLGHGETARNGTDRTDPDSYQKGGQVYRLTDNKPWSIPQDNKDSSKHGYMKKLRTALGLNPTPGATPTPGGSSGTESATGSDCGNSDNDTAPKDIDLTTLTQPSDSISCASGTKDVGIYDGYTEGNKVKIRLCEIPKSILPSDGQESSNQFGVRGASGGVLVNSRVSNNVLAMAKAMRAANLPVVKACSSFRTMEHQTSLYNGSGGSGKVAKPGYSNHQLGVAIDFYIDNNGCADSSNGNGTPNNSPHKVWDWLVDKAGTYQYKQLPFEFWHWSPNGG